jgi:hypothetical protein
VKNASARPAGKYFRKSNDRSRPGGRQSGQIIAKPRKCENTKPPRHLDDSTGHPVGLVSHLTVHFAISSFRGFAIPSPMPSHCGVSGFLAAFRAIPGMFLPPGAYWFMLDRGGHSRREEWHSCHFPALAVIRPVAFARVDAFRGRLVNSRRPRPRLELRRNAVRHAVWRKD